jgi:glucokinase
MRVLAGDVGGTKTNVGLFGLEGESQVRVRSATYSSADHPGLDSIVTDFLRDGESVGAACFGIAGPVVENRVRPPNLDWEEDGDALANALGIPVVRLINDLHATAEGIPALGEDEIVTLAEGRPRPGGHTAIIAAGTGLGVSIVAREGRHTIAVASEGGHTTFAPRNEAELALAGWLADRHGHVELEQVVSGRGLANIHEHLTGEILDPAEVAARGGPAVDLFLGAYGAAAGDLALTCLPRRGLFVGGGIAPKMLDRIRDGAFMEAFLAKGRFRAFLEKIPVKVILNPETALLGAARCAADLAG